MNLYVHRLLILCIFFVLCSTVRAEVIEKGEPIIVFPNRTVMEQWMDDFFEGPDLFFFRNASEFSDILESTPMSEGVRTLVQRHFTPIYWNSVLPDRYIHAQSLFYFPQDEYAVLVVDAELREKLPYDFLTQIYRKQIRLGLQSYRIEGKSKDAIIEKLGQASAGEEVHDWLLRNIFPIRRKVWGSKTYAFFANKANWRLIPEEERSRMIFKFIERSSDELSLDPEITIFRSDDLDEIARKYSLGRNPEILKRYLAWKFKQTESDSLTLPLVSILNRFIRRHVNQFAECSGPNCVNAALSSAMNSDVVKYIDPSKLRNQLRGRFEEVGSPPKPGDVVVFFDSLDEPIHIVTSVGEDLVFTKNGLTKSGAWKISTLSDVRRTYSETSHMRVFRLISPLNQPTDSPGGGSRGSPLSRGSLSIRGPSPTPCNQRLNANLGRL